MAGAGYRTWTAGEVVTASNVQSYLQDQTIGVYAGTAARSSAILSPSEGQVSYRTDDDVVEVYDGSAWVPVAPADTAGLIHIETQTFTSVASFSFSNDVFSANYTNYKIVISKTAGANFLSLRLRAAGTDASGSNYVNQSLRANSTTLGGSRQTSTSHPAGLRTDEQSLTIIELNEPFTAIETGLHAFSTNKGTPDVLFYSGFHNLSTSYDSCTIIASASTMTGTASIYGYRK